MSSEDNISIRVPRPDFARESDPRGFSILNQELYLRRLSYNEEEQVFALTESQFQMRQWILPKKKATRERRLRIEAAEKEQRRQEFRMSYQEMKNAQGGWRIDAENSRETLRGSSQAMNLNKIAGLHEGIASEILADKDYWLTCQCGVEQQITAKQFAHYLRNGWPKHCGYTMSLQTIARGEGDGQKP